MLDSLRVLDLTDEKGYLCGKMLADLGADVVKIEKPGGDPGRRLGPFCGDPHPEKSLHWFAYNANKRGITLNIEANDGKELFIKLASTADVVVESFAPGYLDSLALGYGVLSAMNHRIILTSITPFGQAGPYREFKGSDIVLMAMGGYMNTCGDPDRAPLRVGFPQAYLHASAEAAVGTLMACYYAQTAGEGQHVDVSAQHSVSCTASGVAYAHWILRGINLNRAGEYRVGLSADAKQRQLWPCKDGYISFQIFGGRFGAKTNRALTAWMESEGMATDLLREMRWETFDMAQVNQELMERLEEPIGRFFLTRTKVELDAGAVERDIVLYPVNTIANVFANPQLGARGFWVDVEHPELNRFITYPGAWLQASGAELEMRCRAPLIGEHNGEIYLGELGLSKSQLSALHESGVI